jgi:hypothetical protein
MPVLSSEVFGHFDLAAWEHASFECLLVSLSASEYTAGKG